MAKIIQIIGGFNDKDAVKSVNGMKPDKNGDVKIPAGVDVARATVGQMIVVKAVDKNGKPTEWEAVDMPEIPEQVQADWNENDPNAPGHVENRTHYTETVQTPKTATFTAPIFSLNDDMEFARAVYEQRKTARYTVGGVDYVYKEDIPYDNSAPPSFMWTIENAIGDIKKVCAIRNVADNGEFGDMQGQFIFEVGATITVYCDTEVIHKLDEKYLPDSGKYAPPPPMLVTTESIDAGSAFVPSATFAEMLEALEKGATVWVQIEGNSYLVTAFNTTEIQCRWFGTKFYKANSKDGLFR